MRLKFSGSYASWRIDVLCNTGTIVSGSESREHWQYLLYQMAISAIKLDLQVKTIGKVPVCSCEVIIFSCHRKYNVLTIDFTACENKGRDNKNVSVNYSSESINHNSSVRIYCNSRLTHLSLTAKCITELPYGLMVLPAARIAKIFI